MPTTLSFLAVIVRRKSGLPAVALAGRSLAAARTLASHPLSRQLMERLVLPRPRRSPLLPTAVRVEKSTASRGDMTVEQKAVTLWLDDIPALPGVAATRSGGGGGGNMRIGAGLLGLVAFLGMGYLAARRQLEERGRF